MIPPKEHYRELQYRPQAAKTLRQSLIRFITREFPRLGGPWVIELFVDRLLELVDTSRVARDRLEPGQTVWQAVALDERPGYRKPMTHTRQVPVVITLINQDDIAALRTNAPRREVLKDAVVRVANEAYAQGGLLTGVDLAVLFHHSHNHVSKLIREYEAETGQIVPRRGNLHDMGRTVTHKQIICRKAYLEGKPTHIIARETFHSPEAVDHYTLDFARVHFATSQQGMTLEETAFAIQQPVSYVKQYVKLIEEFALDDQQVCDQVGVQMSMCDEGIQPSLDGDAMQNQGPEPVPG
ncbi:MAG TPA: DUF1670 domain-containing protein [Anaerolineae bacterium]|nr:DUF1670 domain-containing protein [Anaerolineae bacterium]